MVALVGGRASGKQCPRSRMKAMRKREKKVGKFKIMILLLLKNSNEHDG